LELDIGEKKPADLLSLAEAVDLLEYAASCETCKEVRRIDLRAMLARLGPDALVCDIRPRLRCKRCGQKNVICVTLWRSATTTERMMERWK
jgi:hypothetical protein